MKYYKALAVLIFFLAAVVSCRKDDAPAYEYFVSSELSGTYPESYIEAMLGIAVQAYPELAEVKPFIMDGVNVYKIVYKTHLYDEVKEASGLVSVPATPGEYPVLSFQNGTNTVNANCPSENPQDYFYQLAEFIAGMGFIVIIPDYPGFGSSADVPHPYLIADPTVQSITDMFRAVNEGGDSEFPGVVPKNEYYLMGYSQGGWATMSLHRNLETEQSTEFILAGSVCGAGPYDMYDLFLGISVLSTYPMPSYIGYIVNAYSIYNQFSNRVDEILNEPFASDLSSLYDGTLTTGEINERLTTSIPGLFRPGFISGFAGSPVYSSVRQGLIRNSISPWNTQKPVLLVHGGSDTHVNVISTQKFYDAMIDAGTSSSIITKLIVPDLDHGDALVPCVTEGLKFIVDLRDNRLD
jgi:pimeloyl-ACP methyl ester carboxylesterase